MEKIRPLSLQNLNMFLMLVPYFVILCMFRLKNGNEGHKNGLYGLGSRSRSSPMIPTNTHTYLELPSTHRYPRTSQKSENIWVDL